MSDKIKQISEYMNNNQDNKVYVEFGFDSITMDGSYEEWEETIERLREEYKDGIFVIKGDTLISIDGNMKLYKYHNLIDTIYEWNE